MRTPWDARRSLHRYIALALGPSWEVALAADRGEFAYPFARVQAVGDVTRSGPALYADLSQPMSVQCYPEPKATAVASEQQAAEVLGTLERAFSHGVDLGRPLRIPLYDFDGVALEDTSYARHPSDYLRVLDFSGRTLPDPEEARNVAVVADVRLGWRATGRVPYEDTAVVEKVSTGYDAERIVAS